MLGAGRLPFVDALAMAGCACLFRKYAITSQMMPPISATCRKKPSTLASAPKPKMLASKPPMRPPIRIPRQPPKHEALPSGAGAVARGCVIDFSMGAARGDVFVEGGAE